MLQNGAVPWPGCDIDASAPRIAGCHASKRAGWRPATNGCTTYRPRSVSSLLMRFRAMVCCGCVRVCVEAGRRECCCWRRDGVGCRPASSEVSALILAPGRKCGVSAEGPPSAALNEHTWDSVQRAVAEVRDGEGAEVGVEQGQKKRAGGPWPGLYHVSKSGRGRDKPAVTARKIIHRRFFTATTSGGNRSNAAEAGKAMTES